MHPTVVITGASGGIGAEAVRVLTTTAAARIIITGTSEAKTKATAAGLGVDYVVCDYRRLDDVRHLASRVLEVVDRVDVLVHNAGRIYANHQTTPDGFEATFQVNYLAPFLLTNLLLGRMREVHGAVVSTTSGLARLIGTLDLDHPDADREYSAERAYANAKFAGLLFGRELDRRFRDQGLCSILFDPGGVRTNFGSELRGRLGLVYRTPVGRLLLAKPQRAGAHLAGHILGAAAGAREPGGHYVGARLLGVGSDPANTRDDRLAEDLWQRTTTMLGLEPAC